MDDMAYQATARGRFIEMVRGSEARIDLGRAALLVASEEYPGLDMLRYVAKLEAMAAAARRRLAAAEDPLVKIQRLSTYLFEERGFRGNADAYYDPRNSFLNEVLDRRVGIPITLSIVYMEVGRRVDIPLQGVGMPGHFILQYMGSDDVYIDPFNGGRVLSRTACQELVQEMYSGQLPFEDTFLEPVTKKQMLARVLLNLKAIYVHRKSYVKALSVVVRLLLIQPEAEQEIKDRVALRNLIGMLN
jgi:regulator of sirC expression with transglutaminase-like and TPR domain